MLISRVVCCLELTNMAKDVDILRSEIDNLVAENLMLRAEVAELKSELTALNAGLDDKIQAIVLRTWADIVKPQLLRELQLANLGSDLERNADS